MKSVLLLVVAAVLSAQLRPSSGLRFITAKLHAFEINKFEQEGLKKAIASTIASFFSKKTQKIYSHHLISLATPENTQYVLHRPGEIEFEPISRRNKFWVEFGHVYAQVPINLTYSEIEDFIRVEEGSGYNIIWNNCQSFVYRFFKDLVGAGHALFNGTLSDYVSQMCEAIHAQELADSGAGADHEYLEATSHYCNNGIGRAGRHTFDLPNDDYGDQDEYDDLRSEISLSNRLQFGHRFGRK